MDNTPLKLALNVRQPFGIIRSTHCQDRRQSQELDGWNVQEQELLSKEDHSCKPRKRLGDVTPALLGQYVNLQLPLSL